MGPVAKIMQKFLLSKSMGMLILKSLLVLAALVVVGSLCGYVATIMMWILR